VNSVTGGTDTGALSITSVANGTATGCSYSGTTLTASTSGTCTLTVTKAATTNYNAATTTATFTFNKATQEALVITASNLMRGETTSISISGGSTLETISFSISSGPCSLNGTTLSSSGTGTCVLIASRPGNSDYELVTATKSITISPSNVAGLASLVITPGIRSFDAATSTYAISVSNTVTTISITPTFTSPFSSATFGGAALTSGVAKTYTPTNGINTPINIVVTAQDGVTTRTYIVKVTKVVTTKTTTSPKPTPAPTAKPTPAPTRPTTQPAKVPAVSLSPRITNLSNTSGTVGSLITITGSNLTGATVRLNGKPASVSSNNGTQLVIQIPVGASSGVITILTSKGSASSARFTVNR
jgi:hypothetical protein